MQFFLRNRYVHGLCIRMVVSTNAWSVSQWREGGAVAIKD